MEASHLQERTTENQKNMLGEEDKKHQLNILLVPTHILTSFGHAFNRGRGKEPPRTSTEQGTETVYSRQQPQTCNPHNTEI